MVDFLQKGQTINRIYYASEVRQLKEAINTKRRGKLRSGILLLQDNAPVHTAQMAMATERCSFVLLPHAPYSLDFVPSDFYLFPKLKSYIRGRHFQSDNDANNAVSEYLEVQDAVFFLEGIAKLEHLWAKGIVHHGDYVKQ